MPKEGIDKIEREVNDFHSEWINFPPKRPLSRLDVLGSIRLKYVRKLNCLLCGEFLNQCNIILFFKSILVIFECGG